MNNTFCFSRFGKLLAFDGKKYLHNFGITLIILCSLNIANWLMSLIFGLGMPTFIRWMVIYVAAFLSMILVPAKAFGDINLPREGVRYAILPVSNLEKYLSYVLYCVLTPVFVVFFSWGLDSLLTLLPFGGFHDYIKSISITNAFMDLFNGEGVMAADLDDMGYFSMMSKIGSMEGWNYLVGTLFTVGLFMMGNLLFKTHKTGKTFGIMIGISYVLSTLVEIVMLTTNFRDFFLQDLSNGNFSTFGALVSGSMTVSIIFTALLTIGLYVGIFFKLKNQKY